MKRNITDSEAAVWRKADEIKKLRIFASKITKVPESVRVYSNPLIMKKRESRGEREDGKQTRVPQSG